MKRYHGAETIGATVVGAGVHTMEISGSTIEYARELLPIRNVPILRVPDEQAADPARLAARQEQLALLNPDDLSRAVAVCFSGQHINSFASVQETAQAIIDGAATILNGPNPLVVVLENDRAKVLGQSRPPVQRGRRDDVVCIDGVHTGSGDYIDIGAPVGAGRRCRWW